MSRPTASNRLLCSNGRPAHDIELLFIAYVTVTEVAGTRGQLTLDLRDEI